MLAYTLLLLGILLLYAALTGRGKAVYQAIIGQATAGRPLPASTTQAAGQP